MGEFSCKHNEFEVLMKTKWKPQQKVGNVGENL